jgi:hypothetical protein
LQQLDSGYSHRDAESSMKEAWMKKTLTASAWMRKQVMMWNYWKQALEKKLTSLDSPFEVRDRREKANCLHRIGCYLGS